MRAVWLFASKIAPSEAPVLIRGEPGVGKELVAEMIHSQSRRSAGSFIRVPCKGIREADAEARLFGPDHSGVEDENGRGGMLHAAQGGTLFLADVECMPLWAQVRLFNAFQRRCADGGDGLSAAGCDVRLMASTSCDLEALVDDGRFFGGLYYLLNVAAVHVPPLRERREDIKGLAEHFLRETLAKQDIASQGDSLEFHRGGLGMSAEPRLARQPARVGQRGRSCRQHWPTTRRSTAGRLTCGPSKRAGRNGDTISVPFAGNLREIERHIIEEVIRRCRGNKAAAARAWACTGRRFTDCGKNRSSEGEVREAACLRPAATRFCSFSTLAVVAAKLVRRVEQRDHVLRRDAGLDVVDVVEHVPAAGLPRLRDCGGRARGPSPARPRAARAACRSPRPKTRADRQTPPSAPPGPCPSR